MDRNVFKSMQEQKNQIVLDFTKDFELAEIYMITFSYKISFGNWAD